MRTKKDCIYLAGVIAGLNEAQLSLLFGLLCGNYLQHPDAVFWDTIIEFGRTRSGALLRAALK
jgi:hypothetical protein